MWYDLRIYIHIVAAQRGSRGAGEASLVEFSSSWNRDGIQIHVQ